MSSHSHLTHATRTCDDRHERRRARNGPHSGTRLRTRPHYKCTLCQCRSYAEVGEIFFVVVRIFIEMVVYLPAQVYAKLLQGNVTDSPFHRLLRDILGGALACANIVIRGQARAHTGSKQRDISQCQLDSAHARALRSVTLVKERQLYSCPRGSTSLKGPCSL